MARESHPNPYPEGSDSFRLFEEIAARVQQYPSERTAAAVAHHALSRQLLNPEDRHYAVWEDVLAKLIETGLVTAVPAEPLSVDNFDGRYTVPGCAEIVWDSRDGLGAVGNNTDIRWFGLLVLMPPEIFLRLAAPLDQPRASLGFLERHRQVPGLGPPMLYLDVSDRQAMRVIGHEGRHRATLVMRLCPGQLMPVALIPQYLRAKNVDDALVRSVRVGVFSERTSRRYDDSRFIVGPLFEAAFVERRLVDFRAPARSRRSTVGTAESYEQLRTRLQKPPRRSVHVLPFMPDCRPEDNPLRQQMQVVLDRTAGQPIRRYDDVIGLIHSTFARRGVRSAMLAVTMRALAATCGRRVDEVHPREAINPHVWRVVDAANSVASGEPVPDLFPILQQWRDTRWPTTNVIQRRGPISLIQVDVVSDFYDWAARFMLYVSGRRLDYNRAWSYGNGPIARAPGHLIADAARLWAICAYEGRRLGTAWHDDAVRQFLLRWTDWVYCALAFRDASRAMLTGARKQSQEYGQLRDALQRGRRRVVDPLSLTQVTLTDDYPPNPEAVQATLAKLPREEAIHCAFIAVRMVAPRLFWADEQLGESVIAQRPVPRGLAPHTWGRTIVNVTEERYEAWRRDGGLIEPTHWSWIASEAGNFESFTTELTLQVPVESVTRSRINAAHWAAQAIRLFAEMMLNLQINPEFVADALVADAAPEIVNVAGESWAMADLEGLEPTDEWRLRHDFWHRWWNRCLASMVRRPDRPEQLVDDPL